jgi:hypothetical protein
MALRTRNPITYIIVQSIVPVGKDKGRTRVKILPTLFQTLPSNKRNIYSQCFIPSTYDGFIGGTEQ